MASLRKRKESWYGRIRWSIMVNVMKVIRLTIKEAVINGWMKEREHLIRKNTMLTNQNSLNHLVNNFRWYNTFI